MTTLRRALHTLWPITLLVVFVLTWRRPPHETPDSASTSNCDLVQSTDAERLEECVAADPRNIETMTRLGDGYAASGRTNLAERTYERALAIDPHEGPLHLRLARLQLARGDSDGAAKSAAAALRWLPGSAEAADVAAEARRAANRGTR